MNLYQVLNQSYRDFKNNELKTLKESEDDKKCNIEDIDEEAKGLEDQLKQTTDPKERQEIQERLKELKSQAEKCNECDTTEPEEEIHEGETTVEVPIKVEVADTEVVSPEVTVEDKEVEVPEEVEEVIDDSEKEPESMINDSEKDQLNNALDILNSIIETINTEGSIDATKLKDDIQLSIDYLNGHAGSDEFEEGAKCETEDKFTECEVKSLKVTRIAPSTNSYMIEAETTEGLKYIVGKNYDKENHTLDEAEIFDAKDKASNHFKTLLK